MPEDTMGAPTSVPAPARRPGIRDDLDFLHVRRVVAPDRIPVLGNEHRMVRVAFDLFRLDGDDEERLWQVQADDDGNEFLVRTYDLPGDVEGVLETRSADWSVMADSKLANLTVAYKGVPIHRLAAADYGARSPDEVRMLRQLVSEKLASDQAWAARLLCDLPPAKLAALRETFPEFSKAADDPAGFPAPKGLMDLFEWLRGALEAQGGYSALSEKQQERFNEAADKLDEIKLKGASLGEQSTKALLAELADLIMQFEKGAETARDPWAEQAFQSDMSKPSFVAEAKKIVPQVMEYLEAHHGRRVSLQELYHELDCNDIPLYMALHALVKSGHVNGVSPYDAPSAQMSALMGQPDVGHGDLFYSTGASEEKNADG
jgi:hypothetical protein